MYKGRIDRLGFFVGSMFLFGPFALGYALYITMYLTLGGDEANGADIFQRLFSILLIITGIIWTAVMLPVYFGLLVRRLHDVDISGLASILHLIPGVNLALYLILIAAPGSRGSNKYGGPQAPRDPLGILFSKSSLSHIRPVEEKPMPPPLEVPPPR